MLFRLNSVLYEPFPIANYLRRTVAVVNHSMQMQKKSTAHAPWSRCVSLFAVLLLLKLQTEEIFIHFNQLTTWVCALTLLFSVVSIKISNANLFK